jgi:hypothetical protein
LERVRGWSWDPNADAFVAGFQHAARFAARERHCRVPAAHRENGFSPRQVDYAPPYS